VRRWTSRRKTTSDDKAIGNHIGPAARASGGANVLARFAILILIVMFVCYYDAVSSGGLGLKRRAMKKNSGVQKRLRELSKTLQVVRNRRAYVPVRTENPRLMRVRRNSSS
jgi:hypothetical protein